MTNNFLWLHVTSPFGELLSKRGHFVHGIAYERYEKIVFETRSQITQ